MEPAAGPPGTRRAAGSTLRGGALSSAILYVAIVAIWAGVLIPRWLRRDSSPNSSSEPASDDLSDDLGDDLGDDLSTAEPDAPVAEEPAPRPRREDPEGRGTEQRDTVRRHRRHLGWRAHSPVAPARLLPKFL